MSGPLAVLEYGVLDTAPELAFDDVVALAAQLCGAPTALVSLLDTDRQWFKAKVGFACDETNLDSSVCRYTVAEAQTIVIPDLTADPRTAANPLVTADPHIRFYAGVPLTTRFGIVGALCVIDVVPRPDGLTLDQQLGLERLARQVVQLLEARRHGSDLEAALAARDASLLAEEDAKQRWHDLYRNMNQGFVCGHALRDEDGSIVDWRYEDVNSAWGELVGVAPEDARGKTLRELIPGVEQDWVTGIAGVVDTHDPVHFTKQVGVLGRWYDGMAQWIGDDDFTIIFHEVTDRVKADRRRNALISLGDMLRDETDIAIITRKAGEIIGEAMGAIRAAYGELNHDRGKVTIGGGWAQPGAPVVEGQYSFSDYGQVLDDLLAGRVLVIDDIRTDIRTMNDAAQWAQLQARATVNVPVRESGRTVAVLFVHHAEPHQWSEDEVAFLRNAADRLEIGIAQRRGVMQQEVVNGEIAHRLKNTLAMVQAIASQTLRSGVEDDALDGFMRRLQALGTAHDALTAAKWQTADIRPVVRGVLDALGLEERCSLDGPSVAMGARAALSTSLLLHELATNAVKYGALSRDQGKVAITWCVDETSDPRITFNWLEQGGPEVVEPKRKGFGSKLLRLGLIGTGGSTVRYNRSGLSASFEANVEQVGQA